MTVRTILLRAHSDYVTLLKKSRAPGPRPSRWRRPNNRPCRLAPVVRDRPAPTPVFPGPAAIARSPDAWHPLALRAAPLFERAGLYGPWFQLPRHDDCRFCEL